MEDFLRVIYAPLNAVFGHVLKKNGYDVEKRVTSDEDLHELNINTLKKPMQCGAVCPFEEKIDLATTEHVTDYHSHKAENGKMCYVLRAQSLRHLSKLLLTD